MIVVIGILFGLCFLLLCMMFIETHIIPHLSPENKFKIWWKNNIIDEMSDHL